MSSDRLPTIDAIRGVAVLGILLMNIVALGLPAPAYVDPHAAGGASGADLAAWALAYVFADGKMRALFTLLFGASLILAAERDAAPAGPHYRRMTVLLLLGLAHAWLLWFGDILTQYAVAGAIAFIGWRWRPPALLFVAALCFALTIADDLLAWQQLTALKAAASFPDAPDAVIEAWAQVRAAAVPPLAVLAHEIALYRGGFLDAFAARAPTTWLFQSVLLPLTLPETLGYVASGMALQRLGFFTGQWRRGAYWACLAAGLLALLLYLPLVRLLVERRFDSAVLPLADALSFMLRPALVLAYAAAVLLLVRSGRLPRAVARLVAAGRMALSNYLGTTLIATTLFYGYGFGLYARLDRAELYGVVLLIWAAILLWSKPWLHRFAYGPVEWLWRALSRWSIPPFRRN